MVDAARAAGVSLCVAYRRRLFPQVVAAKRLIEEGRIGGVVSVRTHYSGNMDIEDGAWRGDAAIGGSLMEMACHRMEVMLNFGGEVESLSAMMDTVRKDRGWAVDDTDAMVVRFKSGLIGMHSTILTSPPRHDFVQVDGTAGRIIIDNLEYFSDSIVVESEGAPGPNGRLVDIETIPVPTLDLSADPGHPVATVPARTNFLVCWGVATGISPCWTTGWTRRLPAARCRPARARWGLRSRRPWTR